MNRTYVSQKAFCDALGIHFVEVESLSDQRLDEDVEQAKRECGLFPLPGPKHDDDTKQAISDSNKEHYKTPEGQTRKQLLSERNKQVKSAELKKRWSDNYDEMKAMVAEYGGRRKGSKDLRKRKTRTERPVMYGSVLYENAVIAAQTHYPNDPNGPHYVRRLCRLQRMEWKYYDQDSRNN